MSNGIVGKPVQSLVGWELCISVIVTLAVVWRIVVRCGLCGGYTWCDFDGLKEPLMVSISDDLYVDIILLMAWSQITSGRGVRDCVFVVEVGWNHTLLWNVAMDSLGVGWMVSRA